MLKIKIHTNKNMLNQNQIDELVLRSQEGDQDAFGQIYDHMIDQIYKYVFFKTPSMEIAEDLTEDIFFKVWKNVKKYKKQKYPFSSWVFRIAHNEVVDFYRKNKSVIALDEALQDQKRENMPETLVENKLIQKEVQSALQNLPEKQSQAIVLKYINDFSNQEIAYTMNKSETAIRILLSRGLEKLKKMLTEKGFEKLV